MTLVAMAKDGVTLGVHPSCVAAHVAAGWAIATDAPAAEPNPPSTPSEPPRRGRGRPRKDQA